MIRKEEDMSISRFSGLVGVPRRTYHCRLVKLRAGEPQRGPWPVPVVDRIEPLVAKYVERWDAWGHRNGLPGVRFPARGDAYISKDETADYLEHTQSGRGTQKLPTR